MSFNKDLLIAQEISEGDFFKQFGEATFIPGTIDNNNGTIGITESGLKTGSVSSDHSSGTLAKVKFRLKGEGMGSLNLNDVSLLDPSGSPIKDGSGNQLIPLKSDGACYVKSMPEDITTDGVVNIFDLVMIGKAFGSSIGGDNWNPRADIAVDGKINIFDLVKIGIAFGRVSP